MIKVATGNENLRNLLTTHPRISEVVDDGRQGLRFSANEWQREIAIGDYRVDLHGLVELVDNNPMVCADRFAVPSPVATLTLIALGPIASAGLLVEPPTVATNLEADEHEIDGFLASTGWAEGVTLHSDPADLNGLASATVIAAIKTPDDLDDIDALYEERFGRSFYVLRDEDNHWGPELVAGTPFAKYRLRIAVDEPYSLLTIRVIADIRGKAGETQVVHAFNVMNGFEESLGIN